MGNRFLYDRRCQVFAVKKYGPECRIPHNKNGDDVVFETDQFVSGRNHLELEVMRDYSDTVG